MSQKIKRIEVDASIERNIITGMITSNDFLKEIQPVIRTNLLQSSFARSLAKWCLEYYEEYEEAPKVA